MSSRLPPTPSENLSHKGSGEHDHANARGPAMPAANDSRKQGQQANSRINTTHQGHQQDR